MGAWRRTQRNVDHLGLAELRAAVPALPLPTQEPGDERMRANRLTARGVVLIVLLGLLNFHAPHFLLEPGRAVGTASAVLEVVLLANVLAAVVAAVGIARGQAWGWRLGVAVASFSVVLWLAQETIGLPGLPRQWGEPSRIVALLLEAAFFALARAALGRAGRAQAAGTR